VLAFDVRDAAKNDGSAVALSFQCSRCPPFICMVPAVAAGTGRSHGSTDPWSLGR